MGQYLTTEEFIRRAKRVHGEKFDYSKTNYVSQMTPVTFVCRECGKENKVYSPNTCCFLPHELNGLICRCNGLRGALPIGVRKAAKGKYKAELRKTMKKFTFGVFDTPQEAFEAYKREKEAYIKELAQKHFDAGNISKKVHDAFINYKVEITD